MLGVRLICVGKMRERFYIDAFEEYRKRLGAYCRFYLMVVFDTSSICTHSPETA